MARYLVTWEIDYEGEGDPEAAARWAWDILRKPHSTASVFTMIDEDGNETKIDLAELDEARLESPISSVGDVLRRLTEEARHAHR
ncbi:MULTISPECIES: hypothetical protein [unclassified Mesorhizobium]|uniref:hypothetical protein n=1 Tax=unclassified Mesorhizobium TaxID=325217 RepID=UPI000BB0B98D|nr:MULTISPECIES: hypothetical protein [unclassified Mesorhizobium]TGV90089.1 hypothetical protein EN801_020770 [Mesorhizobium sp. M00.F.Ca.ET.158.01.1.1]AZO61755.1 hypothetical protein EJ078_22680 [Mesorhizobium sp. M1A.F.Ca.IN.022.06.1.1]MDG4853839.1 hypothetical protein [Mesorhizobium sp. WSM4982]MDG4915684.1 hypothetical protein [Mesorhizobium sp. WSM4983]PBB29772.1 hypothetical protein CK214_23655 [Mesorhizobium sp. WSM3882]